MTWCKSSRGSTSRHVPAQIGRSAKPIYAARDRLVPSRPLGWEAMWGEFPHGATSSW
jgi:hypothetical protein